ncbi:MAG: hypothetical protein AB7I12_09410 [Steroidobacteraceae bacterium]
MRGDFYEIRMGSPQFASLKISNSPCQTVGRSFGELVSFSSDSKYLAAEELTKWSPPETRAVVFNVESGQEFIAHVQAPGFIKQLNWQPSGALNIHAWSHIAGDSIHTWKVS